jgi:hypothetical protein
MPESQHSILASFGLTNVGRQKSAPRWSRIECPTEIIDPSEALQFAPIEAATDFIRKDIKSYIQGSYFKTLSACFAGLEVSTVDLLVWPVSPISEEMETAIIESRRILEVELGPDAGIDFQYSEETWKRATKLLRELAKLFWDDNASFLSVPSIGPAEAGSIDLFWELKNLTLLVNIPADMAKTATFYGRRLEGSKISGSLAHNDIEPRHLTAWLSDRE